MTFVTNWRGEGETERERGEEEEEERTILHSNTSS